MVAVLALVVVSFVVFPGGSDVRWALLVLILIILSLVAFLSLYRAGVRVPPLEAPPEGEVVFRGELSRLARVLERADRGMRYSQVVAARRLRQAFLARLQATRGLTEDELAAFLASPPEMERLVGDPVIREFLENTAPAEKELLRQEAPSRPRSFRFSGGEQFTKEMGRILRAMEAMG